MWESAVNILIAPVTSDPVFNYFFTLVLSFGVYSVMIGLLIRIVAKR